MPAAITCRSYQRHGQPRASAGTTEFDRTWAWLLEGTLSDETTRVGPTRCVAIFQNLPRRRSGEHADGEAQRTAATSDLQRTSASLTASGTQDPLLLARAASNSPLSAPRPRSARRSRVDHPVAGRESHRRGSSVCPAHK